MLSRLARAVFASAAAARTRRVTPDGAARCAAEPLERRRLLSVNIVSADHAEEGNRTGFVAEVVSSTKPVDV